MRIYIAQGLGECCILYESLHAISPTQLKWQNSKFEQKQMAAGSSNKIKCVNVTQCKKGNTMKINNWPLHMVSFDLVNNPNDHFRDLLFLGLRTQPVWSNKMCTVIKLKTSTVDDLRWPIYTHVHVQLRIYCKEMYSSTLMVTLNQLNCLLNIQVNAALPERC